MSDESLQKVIRFTKARDMWLELERLYGGSCVDQTYNYCLNFFSYKKKEEHNIATHISTLKNIWSDLNLALVNETLEKQALPDILLICKILDTLPQEFISFKSSWLLISKKERTIENLTSQLCAHERVITQNINEPDISQEALIVKTHKSDKRKEKKTVCNYCKLVGHRVRSCRKWIADGKPPKEATANMNLTVLAVNFGEAIERDTWYVDNGATSHVTNRYDFFSTYSPFKSKHTVTGANGQCIDAAGIGDIYGEAIVDDRLEQILLKNVWYVPNISRNLFSVLATHDRSDQSLFESTPLKCSLKVDGKTKIIGTREKNGGLFKLQLRCKKQAVVNELVTNSDSILQLYHERFGHQSKTHVKKVIEKEFNIKTTVGKDLCEGCIYGKSHRQKFGTREKATRPGELMYADVCGPFPYSFSKFRYFVLFKDDNTRYRFVYFLRNKSEVHTKLALMLSEAKANGIVVKELLSDNGGEFDNAEVRTILDKEGVKQRFTMPYTPQQNPTERDNRTVVEMARSLMHAHAEIPVALWAEIINASVYIINRTGPSITGMSPYEAWHKKKPRISHLRIIGTTCYPLVPKQKRKKLNKNANKGILIGYDGDEGYRIWDSDNHRLIRSRDVTFNESLFPVAVSELNTESYFEKPENKLNFGLPQQNRLSVEHNGSETVTQSVENDDVNELTEGHIENADIIANDNIDNKELEQVEEPDSVREEFDEADENETSLSRVQIATEGRMTLRDRSTIKTPSRYNDYICTCTHNVVGEPVMEPTSFKEAVVSKDRDKWLTAMDCELKSLEENNTWEMVELPQGRKALSNKWVYRVKTNADGSVDKYKARLVVKGYSQKKDVDYHATFSPVARVNTIRAVLSVAAKENLVLTQFDVSTAFLYGSLNEDIYMKPPEGFSSADDKKVCRLKRSLYGLKQAPRCWNHCITEYITKAGFKQSDNDPCLFVRNKDDKYKKMILVLYVDDGLIASAEPQEAEKFLTDMKKRFKITSKPGSYFLGFEIDQSEDGSIKIHQQNYAQSLLQRFGMLECKAAVTPIVKDAVCPKKGEGTDTVEAFPYRQVVGALSYLMVGTRPDIAFAVGVVSRTLEHPSPEDVVKVKRILRYIKGTTHFGITYQSGTSAANLTAYSDADHGGDITTSRSTSGIICLYSNGAVAWQSKRQSTVAISSTEAEVVAASEAARELLWLRRIFDFMQYGKVENVNLYVDNESAIRLAHDPPYEQHQRTKHIRLRHFFVRECVVNGSLCVKKVNSAEQFADFLTKPVYKPRLIELSKSVGLA